MRCFLAAVACLRVETRAADVALTVPEARIAGARRPRKRGARITGSALAVPADMKRRMFSASITRTDEARAHFKAPPALTPAAAELFAFFEGQQLHPYRLPMACEFVPGCACCQGYLCDKKCKNDARRICLEPALADHGATLYDRCEVLRLEASRTQVTGVVCRRGGAEVDAAGQEEEM